MEEFYGKYNKEAHAIICYTLPRLKEVMAAKVKELPFVDWVDMLMQKTAFVVHLSPLAEMSDIKIIETVCMQVINNGGV